MRNRIGQAFLNFMEWRRQRKLRKSHHVVDDQICPRCWTALTLTPTGHCQQCGAMYNPLEYGDTRMG